MPGRLITYLLAFLSLIECSRGEDQEPLTGIPAADPFAMTIEGSDAHFRSNHAWDLDWTDKVAVRLHRIKDAKPLHWSAEGNLIYFRCTDGVDKFKPGYSIGVRGNHLFADGSHLDLKGAWVEWREMGFRENVPWSVGSLSALEYGSLSLARTHEPIEKLLPPGTFEFSYGIRFLALYDRRSMRFPPSNGAGDLSIKNQLIGPQLGVQWRRAIGPLSLIAKSTLLFGYNHSDWDYFHSDWGLPDPSGAGPSGIPPAGIPSPSKSSTHADADLSSVGELGLAANWRLTNRLAVNFGYSALLANNIRFASDHLRYNVGGPDVVFDREPQSTVIHGANLGVEVRR